MIPGEPVYLLHQCHKDFVAFILVDAETDEVLLHFAPSWN